MDSPYIKKLLSRPEDLDDQELRIIALSTLSKRLSMNLSSATTLSVYLRWLEANREHPTDRTKLWTNTITQWAQSLNARGFTEREIKEAVNEWKEAEEGRNGSFRSLYKRYPPMPRDIAKAFVQSNLPDRPLDEQDFRIKVKMDWQFEHTAPPKNYQCNRCNKKGHWLQGCPTNLDPSYDMAPGGDYECSICRAVGEHWKSLCPMNTDPYCIYQKRKACGIVLSVKKERLGGMFDDWEGDRELKKSQRFQPQTPTKVDKVFKVEHPDEMNIDSNDVGPTPQRKTPLPSNAYHDFVQQLIASQGSKMTEVVNQKKPRPTALEMWEEDDKRCQAQLFSDSPNKHEEYEVGRLTPYEDTEMTPYEDNSEPSDHWSNYSDRSGQSIRKLYGATICMNV